MNNTCFECKNNEITHCSKGHWEIPENIQFSDYSIMGCEEDFEQFPTEDYESENFN